MAQLVMWWPDLVGRQPFSSEQALARVICGDWFLWMPVRSSEQVLPPGVLAQEQEMVWVILWMRKRAPQSQGTLDAVCCS